MNLVRNRRHSSSTLMLYGFVLLSVFFFVFVFVNMPAAGPKTFGDMQNHFVSSNSRTRKSDRDRPARFRPRVPTSPIPRSSNRPWGLRDDFRVKPQEEPQQQVEEQDDRQQQEEEDRREEERRRQEEEEQQRREEEERRQEEERENQRRKRQREEEEEEDGEQQNEEDQQDPEEHKEQVRKNIEALKARSGKSSTSKLTDKIKRAETYRSMPKEDDIRIALTSAFRGDRYAYMAKLTGETKKKYAEIHGYTFYEDNHLIPEDASWYQRSAIRTKALIEHFDSYTHVYWSDVDVMITNPSVKLESFFRQGAHVILSRDWGDRQVNPGSILMTTSDFSRKFIEQWEEAIREVTDDLRAFEKVMNENPSYERDGLVIYLPQQLINPYHHVETDSSGKLVKRPRPHPDGHDLWKEDSLLVHIINCLRTDRNDCQILADFYYAIAMERFEKLGFPLEVDSV